MCVYKYFQKGTTGIYLILDFAEKAGQLKTKTKIKNNYRI